MRKTAVHAEENQAQKYQRLVVNNPTRKMMDEKTINMISKRLEGKSLNELHKIVSELNT